MIEKLKKIVDLLSSPEAIVMVGDDTLVNQLVKEIGDKTLYVIDMPTANKPDGIGSIETSNFAVKVLRKSVYNNSWAEELNVIAKAEEEANSMMKKLRCALEVEGYRKEIVLMQYSVMASGVKLTFVVGD